MGNRYRQKNLLKRERIVKCFWGDQLKLDTLYKCAENFNTKFDLVVDDGWHHPEAQLTHYRFSSVFKYKWSLHCRRYSP